MVYASWDIDLYWKILLQFGCLSSIIRVDLNGQSYKSPIRKNNGRGYVRNK